MTDETTENADKPLTIGFAYDVSSMRHSSQSISSVETEYEDEQTIAWIHDCLRTLGEVVDLPWEPGTISTLIGKKIDVIFNITEGRGGRNRESLLPAVAEVLGIAYTGSDAMSLGISLDKYLTKVVAQHAGIQTPGFVKLDCISQWDQILPCVKELHFPVIAKPNTGGSSMGIRKSSRVDSLTQLYDAAKWVLEDCGDSVLIEEFIAGRELNVGLLQWGNELRCLPMAEIRTNEGDPYSFYSFEMKSVHKKKILFPIDIDDVSIELMKDNALKIFHSLGCRDIARVDFRIGIDGIVYFLEINPLPGLSPYYSIYPAQAKKAGIEAHEIIGQLIRNALNRNQIHTSYERVSRAR